VAGKVENILGADAMTDTYTVTQADRDCLHAMNIPASADDLLIVARHRTEAITTLQAENARLREALEEAGGILDNANIGKASKIDKAHAVIKAALKDQSNDD
jgi:hypothetical protein